MIFYLQYWLDKRLARLFIAASATAAAADDDDDDDDDDVCDL